MASSPRVPARSIALLLLLSIASSLALAGVYITGGQTQWEGVLIAGAFGALGAALIVWAHHLLDSSETSEPWPYARSQDEDGSGPADDAASVAAFHGALDRDEVLERRPLLRRLLLGSLGAIGLAALFPIRSLGPRPGNALTTTPWGAGRRLVDSDGRVVRRDGVPAGGLMTVFPEGFTDSADAVAILIGIPSADQGEVVQPDESTLVAYSKLCTHAGCPVGLYMDQEETLLCPCHQSVFDVWDGQPLSGPAARPLPRLPIRVTGDGALEATGDFDAPVGPAWWTR